MFGYGVEQFLKRSLMDAARDALGPVGLLDLPDRILLQKLLPLTPVTEPSQRSPMSVQRCFTTSFHSLRQKKCPDMRGGGRPGREVCEFIQRCAVEAQSVGSPADSLLRWQKLGKVLAKQVSITLNDA